MNGRQATAADMKYHIDRNKAGVLLDGVTKDPNFYRFADYQIVDSTTLTDANTLTVKFKQPAPLFLNLLAQSYEVVQAPEAVKEFEAKYAQFNSDQIIGTGPYILTLFNPDGHLNFKKNPTVLRHDVARWYSAGAAVHGPGSPPGGVRAEAGRRL